MKQEKVRHLKPENPSHGRQAARGMLVVVFTAMWCMAPPAVVGEENDAEVEEAVALEDPQWLGEYRLRYRLYVMDDPDDSDRQSIVARVPTGGWLGADPGEVVVQTRDGQTMPAEVLSHDLKGDTLIQFSRHENERWYWAYFGRGDWGAIAGAVAETTDGSFDGDSRPAEEGLVAVFRRWDGRSLEDWASVREGLVASEQVLGHLLAPQVLQNSNPARPGDPHNFAASYHGFLKIEDSGEYRFFLNADDAAFLFINGEMVTQQTGRNRRLGRRTGIPISQMGNVVDLKEGVHSIEVYHVVADDPNVAGILALHWIPPGEENFSFVPKGAFAHPMVATVSEVETVDASDAAGFTWGIDDLLFFSGGELYIVRLEATGLFGEEDDLVWDLGDGTTARGRSIYHIYTRPGDFEVTVRGGEQRLPPFRQVVHIWPEPVETSPLSLGKAVEILAEADLDEYDLVRLNALFGFLLVCEQPERWPVVERFARRLLEHSQALDPLMRGEIYIALMQAVAHQGHGDKAMELKDEAMEAFAQFDLLRARVLLTAADIQRDQIRDFPEAIELYHEVIEEFRRLNDPIVRQAAIHLGDLHAQAGNLTAARDAYRQANSLGGDAFDASVLAGAIDRGSMLRVAEQKLREGDLRACRQMLEEIERNFPEQKLEGLYQLLRAETDRISGHYERAIENYQVLLRLRNWAGMHDKAMYGLADTYFRKRELEQALRWLDPLEESYPSFFERENLKPYREMIEERLKRIREAEEAGSSEGLIFTGFATDFTPENPDGTDDRRIRSLGIDGPYVMTVGGHGRQAELENLVSHGTYWVEFWYRRKMNASLGDFYWINIHTQHGDQRTRVRSRFDVAPTNGRWRKVGYLAEMPLVDRGVLELTLRGRDTGYTEIDGLKVVPVSDRQRDALRSFLAQDDSEGGFAR